MKASNRTHRPVRPSCPVLAQTVQSPGGNPRWKRFDDLNPKKRVLRSGDRPGPFA